MKKISLILCFISTFIFADDIFENPLSVVKQVVGQTINALKEAKTDNKIDKDFIHNLIKNKILPYVEFEEIARASMGKFWKEASGEHKLRYQELLQKRLLQIYGKAFENYENQKVLFKKNVHYRSEEVAVVRSFLVMENKTRIPISYHLYKNKNQWKIYDMDIDGLSMVGALRSGTELALKEANYNIDDFLDSFDISNDIRDGKISQ